MWAVYILKSTSHRWFYVGSTNDLRRRVDEHNSGKVSSTRAYKPLVLVYETAFETEKEARAYEKKIKQKRRLKEELVRNL